MNDFTLDNVNEMYIDVLREIGNIGAGNATTSLASMINEQIDMNVPKVELMEASKLSSAICPEDEMQFIPQWEWVFGLHPDHWNRFKVSVPTLYTSFIF